MKLLLTKMRTLLAIILVLAIAVSPLAMTRPPAPPPPTLSLSAPATGFVDDVVLIDARASIGVHNMPQANGNFSFTMDFGDRTAAEIAAMQHGTGPGLVHILASGHAYRNAGTYTIRINGKNSAGEAATEVTQQIIISEIPPGTIQTLTNTGNLVANATNLNAAILTASENNTTNTRYIDLPDSFGALGPITMLPTTGNKYITIRWAGLSALPRKKRINPETFDLSAMPSILAPNNTSSTASAVKTPNPATTSVVKYYRWQGIRIGRENPAATAGHLMQTGQDTYNGTDQLAAMNHHIIVDRCWFDSGGVSTASCASGLRILSNHTTVVDSWLAYFRLIGQSGVDVQALVIALTQGPVSVRNNHMVASSENMHIGSGVAEYRRADISNPTTTSATLTNGRRFSYSTTPHSEIAGGNTENLAVDSIIALPSTSCAYAGGPYCVEMVTRVTGVSGNNITYEAVPYTPTNGGVANWSDNPSFIEIRNNFFTKPPQWRRYLQDDVTENPVWDGTISQIKNLWETKGLRYGVFDGNVATEGYSQGEQPYQLVLSVRNRTGLYTNTAAIQHIQWSNNLLRNAANNFAITGSDDGDEQDQVSFRTRDILYFNNLSWSVGYEYDITGPHTNFAMGAATGAATKMERVFVMQNTWDGSNDAIIDWVPGAGATDAMWFNNVHNFSHNGFRDSTGNSPDVQIENINEHLPPGDLTSFAKNLVVNPRRPYNGAGYYAPMPNTPDGQTLVIGGVGHDGSSTVDTVSFYGQFVDYSCGNFTLAGTSPGKNASTTGNDVGVMMPSLMAAIGTTNPCLNVPSKTETGNWTSTGPAAAIFGKAVITGKTRVTPN